MDIGGFVDVFETTFSEGGFTDLCPSVKGMTSPKVQRLLQLGVSLLQEGECYFEVGTFKGKTLVSAALQNEDKIIYACDNFSEFHQVSASAGDILRNSLELNCPAEQACEIMSRFFDSDFRDAVHKVEHPIGFYFYDGAHTSDSQRDAILLVEDCLADSAIVVIDDWDHAPVRPSTLAATGMSSHDWELLHELPARFNGDRETWWNGIGILSFARQDV